MKNIFFLFACIITFGAEAQIEYADTQNHLVYTLYAGTLAGPKAVVQKEYPTGSFYSLRAGGTIAWTPVRWLTAFGLGAGETSNPDTTLAFALFGLKIRPAQSITLTAGKTASPMTEFRPLPTTAAGQFEPWTKAYILGSALGVKACFAPTQKFSLTLGNYWRGTQASYEMKIQYGNVAFGGYYMGQTKTYGAALEAYLGRVGTTIMYNQKQNVGMFNTIEVWRSQKFYLYSDVGFDDQCKQMIRGEWGWFKLAQVHFVKMTLGAGYAQKNSGDVGEKPMIKGYVFMHI